MPTGLTDPLTAEDLTAMNLDDLVDHHRQLLTRLRDVDHWHRLISARLDLAVAAVADVPEPLPERLLPPFTAALAADFWSRELMATAVGAGPVQLGRVPTQRAETLAERIGAELGPVAPAPPDGLRDLLGIARFEERLVETALLPRLRQARSELDAYGEALRTVADEVARLIALRTGAGRLPA